MPGAESVFWAETSPPSRGINAVPRTTATLISARMAPPFATQGEKPFPCQASSVEYKGCASAGASTERPWDLEFCFGFRLRISDAVFAAWQSCGRIRDASNRVERFDEPPALVPAGINPAARQTRN